MIESRFENFDLYGYFKKLVEQIPEGSIATFRDLAVALGDQGAALACAYMQKIMRPGDTPMYRLVAIRGNLGGYRDENQMRLDSALLREEGLSVSSGTVIDYRGSLFNDFETSYPLSGMKQEQERYAPYVSLEDDFDPDIIGAVDVSYDDQRGYAYFVYMEDGEAIASEVVGVLRFPYIPGYLFYREYRFIKPLSKRFPGTILIDGNGILHPRFFGLASSAGVFMGKATVGVAKSLLLGAVKYNTVTINGNVVGTILGKRAIVSPGNRISVESSAELLKSHYGSGYPALLRRAHNGTVALRRRSMGL